MRNGHRGVRCDAGRRLATLLWTMAPTMALTVVLTVVLPGSVLMAQDTPRYENLQVLPADISRAELIDIMLDNLSGLGLPRRASEGCLFCHSGSMDVPSREWDWASDDNPMKEKARAMMAMVQEINGTYLASIERTTSTDVGCYTCHAARTNPMSLEEVLLREYDEGGVEAVASTYRTLRTRYYAADAYDFRSATLAGLAQSVAGRGAVEDAALIHQLNIDFSADPAAHQGLIRLRMVEALDDGGVEAMVTRYEALKNEHPSAAYSPLLISPLAWELFRSGREEAGVRLFELNFAEHPDAYVATEDLAWGNESIGNHDRAVELARAWVNAHPDHALGQRLLSDLVGGWPD